MAPKSKKYEFSTEELETLEDIKLSSEKVAKLSTNELDKKIKEAIRGKLPPKLTGKWFEDVSSETFDTKMSDIYKINETSIKDIEGVRSGIRVEAENLLTDMNKIIQSTLENPQKADSEELKNKLQFFINLDNKRFTLICENRNIKDIQELRAIQEKIAPSSEAEVVKEVQEEKEHDKDKTTLKDIGVRIMHALQHLGETIKNILEFIKKTDSLQHESVKEKLVSKLYNAVDAVKDLVQYAKEEIPSMTKRQLNNIQTKIDALQKMKEDIPVTYNVKEEKIELGSNKDIEETPTVGLQSEAVEKGTLDAMQNEKGPNSVLKLATQLGREITDNETIDEGNNSVINKHSESVHKSPSSTPFSSTNSGIEVS